MHHRSFWPTALLAVGLLLGCSKKPDRHAGAGGSATLPAAPSVPQKTTRGDIALRNLSDRIGVLEKRASQKTLILPYREQLAGSLLQRVQFLGTFADFTRVLELGEGAVRDFPNQANAWLLRARAESAVHRFDDALRDLDAAARLGADVDARRASIHLALGHDLEKARDFARTRVERAASVESLGLLANAEAALGEFAAADEHYQAALGTLHDVSPFPVAQLCFQRGLMWAEQAHQPERAVPFYTEALRRIPQYVVANVHLAEIEASMGRRDAAIERLNALVEHGAPGGDPEPFGALAGLLLAKDPHDGRAPALIERARDGYTSLLSQHRTAFLDHGAEFFAGPGADAARALELARENLAMRQTPRAYSLAIESAFAAHDVTTACGWVSEAAALRGHSPDLGAVLDRESGRCSVR